MKNPKQDRSWIPGNGCPARIWTILLGLVAVTALPAQAQGYAETVLHSFTAGTGGATPYAGLVLDTQGNMYGTTAVGGNVTDCSGNGCGTVFMMDPMGNETVLYNFTGLFVDPSTLVLDAQGNLYGTTVYDGPYGFGTVFRVDTNGKYTVLYNFTGNHQDGIFPSSGLLLDGQGNLYGVTDSGGARTQCGGSGCGTVFKLDAEGNQSILYSFIGITPNKADGSEPSGVLVRDALGNLYGTTAGGGKDACDDTGPTYGGCGTVFKLDTTGTETILYTFTGGTDGANPQSGLVMDAQGNLYGTTLYGGAGSSGTVFKLDPSGKLTVLHAFTGIGGDGSRPGALAIDAQGNLFGTTASGGVVNNGTVFKVDKTGKETVLHSFLTADGDGSSPIAGLALDAQGSLYGTTVMGGTSHNGSAAGTVFKLRPAPVTTTTITSSRNPLIFGKTLILTAMVASPAGGAPTGKVYLYDSNFDSGLVPMVVIPLNGSGVAKYKTPAWPLGSNSITAIYAGDANYGGSTSTPFIEVVQEETTTALTSAPNPSVHGQAVTFTATVTCNLGAPPDGEAVSFMKGKTILGTGSLSGGSASFTTSTLKVGTTPVTAVYGGDAKLAASRSSVIKQVVEKATE